MIGDKPANMYVVLWSNYNNKIIKIGITNRSVEERVAQQRRFSKLEPVILEKWEGYSGGLVQDVEKNLKSKYKLHFPVSKDLLPDGYTEAFYYDKEVLVSITDYIESRLNPL